MKSVRATSALLLFATALGAGVEQDQLIKDGNEAFYNLDYDQSLADYEQALAGDPANPILHNHVAHALLYRELFRDGALESELVSGNNSFIRRPKLEPPAAVEKILLRGNRPVHAVMPGPHRKKFPRHSCPARAGA